jgi:hypothetical protein
MYWLVQTRVITSPGRFSYPAGFIAVGMGGFNPGVILVGSAVALFVYWFTKMQILLEH